MKFNDLIVFLNSVASKKVFETNKTGEANRCSQQKRGTLISFGREFDGTTESQKWNDELKLLGEQLTKELFSHNQECYLFTYFYGKKSTY